MWSEPTGERAGKLANGVGRGEQLQVSEYEYELRKDNAVIATGLIQLDESPSPGETLSLGSKRVLIADVLRLGGTPRIILSQN
jgi:hypothetical protein